jgi:hypothetical protein
MARMNVLDIARQAMRGIGLPPPEKLTIVTDDLGPQVAAIMRAVAADAIRRNEGGWQALKREAFILTTATEDQGDITVLFPDFRSFVNGTLHNVTNRRRLKGPISSQQWQSARNGLIQPLTHQTWRQIGDRLYLLGQTTANERVTFEYNSSSWLRNVSGTDRYDIIRGDTDVCLLDADMMIAGVQWHWLEANGLEYAEKFRRYEMALAEAKSRDGGKDVVSLNDPLDQFNYDPTYPYDIVVRT